MLFQVIFSSILINLHMMYLLGVSFSDDFLDMFFFSSLKMEGFQTIEIALLWNRSEMWHCTHTLLFPFKNFFLFQGSKIVAMYFYFLSMSFFFFFFPFFIYFSLFFPSFLFPFFFFNLHWALTCHRLQYCIDLIICKSFWALLLCSYPCVWEMGLKIIDVGLKSCS